MPPLRGFYYLLTLLSYSCFEQTPRNRRFGIPMNIVTSIVGGTKIFSTPEVLKKTMLTSIFLYIMAFWLQNYSPLIDKTICIRPKGYDYSDLEVNTFKQDDRYFEHEKRIIWFQEYTWNHLHVNIYLDESLRINEEKDYLRRIQTHPENYSLQEYHQMRNTFGTIVLLSNLRRNAKEIYQIYKSRMAIELLFDGMKNVLEADHTYMQDEQTLHGWMFINHITLQWYQHLYIELKNRDLLKKYSVNDLIQMLSDLKMIKINDSWHLNEITNYAKRLFEKFEIPIEI